MKSYYQQLPEKFSCKVNGQKTLFVRVEHQDADCPHTTPAEEDLLLLLAQGCSNHQIALSRKCSIHTVSNQLSMLYRKFSVYNRMDLLRETNTNTVEY